MDLFKIVDADHINAVAGGSIKIGTARSYAKLDGPRRDDMDSNRQFEFNGLVRFTGGAGDDVKRAAAYRMGIGVAPGVTASIVNCSGNRVAPSAYLFCMTSDFGSQIKEGQAAFQILDAHGLAAAATRADPRLGVFIVKRVAYEHITSDAFDFNASSDPFVKGLAYRAEAETRIAFEPSGPFESGGFIVDGPSLANFIRRVA